MEEDSPIFFRIRILHKNHFLPLQTPKSVIPSPRRSFQTYPPSHVQNPPRHFSHGCIPYPLCVSFAHALICFKNTENNAF